MKHKIEARRSKGSGSAFKGEHAVNGNGRSNERGQHEQKSTKMGVAGDDLRAHRALEQWLKPQDVDQITVAFGGNMDRLLPPRPIIPEEFRRHSNKWCELQSTWFYKGLPQGTRFMPKEGIDADSALRHLKAIQGSFEPKHEHKQEAVAWLMSLWFEDVILPKEEAAK